MGSQRLQPKANGRSSRSASGGREPDDHGQSEQAGLRRSALGHLPRRRAALRSPGAPQGSWVNAVGSAGYDLADWNGTAGDVCYLPNASLNLQQGSRYRVGSKHDRRARAAEPRTRMTRNAATYYDPNEIKMQLSFTAAYTGNLHLYAVDWDSRGPTGDHHRQRAERCRSRATSARAPGSPSRSRVAAGGTVIDHGRPALAGPNAVLSGIFLGEAGAPPAPEGRKRSRGHLGQHRRLGGL